MSKPIGRRQPSPTNSLATLYPDIAAQWHPTKNGDIRPDQIAARSNKRYWWWCAKSPDHDWQAAVDKRTSGRGCPYCRGLKVSTTNSLAALFPEIAAQWHPTRNGDISPDQVVAGSRSATGGGAPRGPIMSGKQRLRTGRVAAEVAPTAPDIRSR